jgi:predicted HicB family RNase H-like nuclease
MFTPIMAETQKETHKTRSIRIPKQVDKQVQVRAKSQGRSINSQIVYELEQK